MLRTKEMGLREVVDALHKAVQIIQFNAEEINELREKIERLEDALPKKKTISCKNNINKMCNDLWKEEKKRELDLMFK